jgi:tRNA pseudouridine55 synthase
MVAVEGNEHVRRLENGPEAAEVFLEEALIGIGFGVVNTDHRNIEILRIIGAHVLEEVSGFDVEHYLSHRQVLYHSPMAEPYKGPSAVLNLYKRKSETPLQTIERYVIAHPKYTGARMTYAGRLDPMAEGVLVVLSGDKNLEREKYTGMDKDYEFEFMLGVETDTFDVLGKIVSSKDASVVKEGDIRAGLEKYIGTFEQTYPAYSSKVVNGTPLFDLARKGLLAGIELPKHMVTASHIELIGMEEMPAGDLQKKIAADISAVKGDFRQEESLALWQGYFTAHTGHIRIYKARVSCGSGFYVRQLVADVGCALGVGATTVSIVRTRVGEYKLEDSVRDDPRV